MGIKVHISKDTIKVNPTKVEAQNDKINFQSLDSEHYTFDNPSEITNFDFESLLNEGHSAAKQINELTNFKEEYEQAQQKLDDLYMEIKIENSYAMEITPTEYEQNLFYEFLQTYMGDNAQEDFLNNDTYQKQINQYEEQYNQIFIDKLGMTEAEYLERKNQYQTDLAIINSALLAMQKQEKLNEIEAYEQEIMNNPDFQNIPNQSLEKLKESILEYSNRYYEILSNPPLNLEYFNKINPFDVIKIAELLADEQKVDIQNILNNQIKSCQFNLNEYLEYYEVMTEEEKQIYAYLLTKEGRESAEDYLLNLKNNVFPEKIGYNRALKEIGELNLNDEGKIKQDLANSLNVSVDGLKDGIQSFFAGIENAVINNRNLTAEEYKTMYYLQYLSENSKILDEVYEVGTGVGNMLPVVTASMLTSLINPALGSKVGLNLMGVSAYGNSKHQALTEGHDLKTSILYGVLSAGSEVLMEKMGGILGLADNPSTSFLRNMLEEGKEEFIQSYITAGIDAAVLGKEINLDELGPESVKSFLMGAVIAGAINTYSSTVNKGLSVLINGTNIKLSPKQLEEVVQNQNENPDKTLIQIISEVTQNDDLNPNLEKSTINEVQIDNFRNVKANAEMEDTIKASLADNSRWGQFLMKLKNYTDNNQAPDGYDSLTDYKNDIVKTLIETNQIETMANGQFINLIIYDTYIFQELLKTDAGLNKTVTAFITGNNIIKPAAERLITLVLQKMNIDEFNQVFNNLEMQNYVNNLDNQQLVYLIKLLNNSRLNWVSNDLITQKLTQLNSQDLYEVLQRGLPDINSSDSPSVTNCLKILDAIQNKIFTEENLFQNLNQANLYLYLSSLRNVSSECAQKLTQLNETQISVATKVNDNILKSITDPTIKVEIKNNNLYFTELEPYSCYNLTYEINGQEYVEQITTGQSFETQYSIEKIKQAAANQTLKIKSLQKNEALSNLIIPITERHKLYEITVEINGKIINIFKQIPSYYDKINLGSTFPDAQEAKVLSVKGLDLENIKTDMANALYKITCEIQGQIKELFVTSDKYQEINLIDLINKFDLFNFKFIDITKASLDQIKNNLSNIFKYNSSSEIFKDGKYGADQSDIPNLLNKLFTNQTITPIEQSKAQLLNNVIDKYFPNLDDTTKYKLSQKFASSGCEYIAMANALATYMGSLENGAEYFKNHFGYDLYISDDSQKSYNIEAIAFDIFLNYTKNNYKTANDIINYKNSLGVSPIIFDEVFKNYFQERGIKLSHQEHSIDLRDNAKNKIIETIINNNDGFNIVESGNFDLEHLTNPTNSSVSYDGAVSKSQKEGNIEKGIGAHAMLVTDIADDLNLLVSTWSKKSKILSENLGLNYSKNMNDTFIRIRKVNFAIER